MWWDIGAITTVRLQQPPGKDSEAPVVTGYTVGVKLCDLGRSSTVGTSRVLTTQVEMVYFLKCN